MEVTVEFLSTLTYCPAGVPKVVFHMLSQRHEMSLVEFAIVSSLYYEPETVYTTRITKLDDATLRACEARVEALLQDHSARSREHDRILARQNEMLRWLIDREIERFRHVGIEHPLLPPSLP
ncbi:hypothetical protein R6Q59_020273 [Mikania micrantha]